MDYDPMKNSITKRSEISDWLAKEPLRLVIVAMALVLFSTTTSVMYCAFRSWKRSRHQQRSQGFQGRTRDVYGRRRSPSCSVFNPCASCRALYLQDKHLESITML